MNNFELHERAQTLSDTYTPHQLAEMLIGATKLLDDNDRFEDNNFEYRDSPHGRNVRDWLSENLLKILPDAEFAVFTSFKGDGKVDCRDCNGSGLFYQIEDNPCHCVKEK